MGYNNICVQDLVGFRVGHDGWPLQVFLELLEGRGTVLDPFESFPLVDQEIERSASIHRLGNKSVQGNDHSSKFLDLLGVSWWL